LDASRIIAKVAGLAEEALLVWSLVVRHGRIMPETTALASLAPRGVPLPGSVTSAFTASAVLAEEASLRPGLVMWHAGIVAEATPFTPEAALLSAPSTTR